MTAHDSLRWGDTKGFTLAAGEAATDMPTQQLVSARWDYPISWTVLLVMVPQLDPAETQPFTVTYKITVGVGQGTQTYPVTYGFTAAGFYVPISDQKTIPSQDLQIIASLTGNPSVNEGFLIGAFAAPVTEVFALRELMRAARGEGEKHVQWMPHGFYPEEMGYRR
jgi:hypothetical protein